MQSTNGETKKMTPITTAANLTKRQYIATQLLASLIPLDGINDDEIVSLSVKLTDSLLNQIEEPDDGEDTTLPDPAWNYSVLWGLLCTTEAKVKALKTYLTQFEEGTKETDEETYHQLMSILESLNGAMATVRPRSSGSILH